MTLAKRHQALALGVLVAVLGVVAVVQLRGGRPQAAPAARASNQASRGTTGRAQVPVSGVNLDLLERGGDAYPEPERNPFEFKARPAPPPPAAAGRGDRGRAGAPPPEPQGPPPLPPIPWRFIGVFELPGAAGRVGIFSDGRGNTAQVKEGDIIDGRYRVLRIGPDSADVAYADGRGRQSLRLSGQ